MSNGTKQWMAANGINTIDWPACSPDCNPIGNLFGVLTQKIYKDNRRFTNLAELLQEIQRAWSSIPPPTLLNLVNSMPDRIFKVIQKNGDFIG